MTELTKDVPFVWTERTEESFNSLKERVISAPVLQTFHPDYPVIVTTDASTVAIGAVLEQDSPEGRHPVAFTSRTLNPAEQNYAPHELELLAIVDTLRAWRSYFHGRKFTVHTDHYPLKYLQTQEHLSPRQVRWLERLVEFDFDIVPIKGKSNTVADALSRQTRNLPAKDQYNKDLLKSILQKTFETNSISTVVPGTTIVNKLVNEYAQDPEFQKIYSNPKGPFEIKDKLLYMKIDCAYPRDNFDWTYSMTTIQPRTLDISGKQKQDTESSHTTTGNPFAKQSKIMLVAVGFVNKRKQEITNRMVSSSL